MNINLNPFLPELILAGGLLGQEGIDIVLKRRQGIAIAWAGAVLLIIVALGALTGEERVGAYMFDAVVQDGAARFFRLLFIAATLISIGMLTFSFPNEGEPFILMLSSVLGMFLLAGSNDIVTLFVALELVSIPSYVLAGYRRDDVRSGEAALKYIIFGAMSSGLMVYGFSLLFGVSGTTNIPAIAERLAQGTALGAVHLTGLIMVLAGIGYKIAMVPLHFWCPDVYEGSPTPITAFFSVTPKAAGFAALFRLMPLFNTFDPYYGITAVSIFTIASAITMTFGNLGALWQDSLKRMLAYSSIAHAGYILVGFAALAAFPKGVVADLATTAIFFYLVVYMFMNLGAFWIVQRVENLDIRIKSAEIKSDHIRNFKGLGKIKPMLALMLSVFLFSLTGLPPLAGFVGKFYLLAALVKGKLLGLAVIVVFPEVTLILPRLLFGLAVIAVANTVVSLFYYVRIIRDMFLYEPDPELALETDKIKPSRILPTVIATVTILPTLVLGVFFGQLVQWIMGRL